MKRTAKYFLFLFLGLIILANIIFFARDSFTPNMEDLPEGKLLFSTISPDAAQTYTINVYQIKDETGVKDAVRAELLNNADNTTKNIYWQVGKTNAHVSWESDYTVVINDVTIDVRNQVYDWRYPKVVEK